VLVAYTGTHDNDTTLGWYRDLDPQQRHKADTYLGASAETMPYAAIRAVFASVARLAIVPMQDLLALGSSARFNTPGTVSGNWQWRLSPDPSPELATHCRLLNDVYGRLLR
jgi:4-alpha-glucanotransferase